MQCGSCASPDIVKLSHVFATGTTLNKGSTAGAYAGYGAGGGFVAASSGVSMTIAAANASPPRRRSSDAAFVIAFLCLAVLIMRFFLSQRIDIDVLNVLAALFLVICVYGCVKTSNFNKYDFPVLYAEWDRKYQCSRCGTVMEPTNQMVTVSDRRQIEGGGPMTFDASQQARTALVVASNDPVCKFCGKSGSDAQGLDGSRYHKSCFQERYRNGQT